MLKRVPLSLAVYLLLAGAAGAQTFSERWSSSGFSTSEVNQGVALGDYNGDRHADVFLTSFIIDLPWPLPDLGGPDQCYRNNGTARFTNRAGSLDLDDPGQGQGPAWADYDNDGRLDLYVVRGFQQAVAESHLLYHQEATRFDSSPSAYVSAAGAGRSVCWADYDNDGFVDVFVTNGLDSSDLLPDARVYLFRNEGDGSFIDNTIVLGLEDRRNGHGCAWSDFDNDGDQDLYIANHGFEDPILGISDPQPNALYRNLLMETGNPYFEDVAEAAGVTGIDTFDPGGAAFGCAWADYNNDGWMDLYVTNGFAGIIPVGATPNRLFLNNHDGTFTDATIIAFIPPPIEPSFGCTWADYDNDGNIDLYVNNASIPMVAPAQNALFINQGFPLYNFSDEAGPAGVQASEWAQACATADFNSDGWPDIYSINGVPGFELILETPDDLYINDGGSNHWLHLDLVGTFSNRPAIGARITLRTGLRQQTREVSAGSGYQSMDDLRVEFGLGSATAADTITIRWPSGCIQTLENVAADQIIEVVEDCPAFILRELLRDPVSDMFPMAIYQPVPPAPPWEDPQPVGNYGTGSFFYQHTDPLPMHIFVSRRGDRIRISW